MQITDFSDSELLDIQSIGQVALTGSQSLQELAIRFFLNLLTCFLITRLLYFPGSRRGDYSFTFMAFSSAVLLLLHIMGNVEVGVGLTLGLFAIFGIIRYRTETVPVREMTYLFVIIAVAAINGLSTVFRETVSADGKAFFSLSWQDVEVTVMVNALLIVLLWVLEHSPMIGKTASKVILYDRINLIHAEFRDELISDLRLRTGLDVRDVEIGQIDFLKDSAFIKIYYLPKRRENSTIQSIRKLYGEP